MTPFEEELKQISNLSDEYINPIIDEYFQYATFDNILGDSFEDAFDNSQFIDSIYDIYNQLKKFEPVSLSYLERKIFGIICQELSTNVVMEDNSYNFFRSCLAQGDPTEPRSSCVTCFCTQNAIIT